MVAVNWLATSYGRVYGFVGREWTDGAVASGGAGGARAGEVMKTKAQAIRVALKPSARKSGPLRS
jgi:hypothetical protein